MGNNKEFSEFCKTLRLALTGKEDGPNVFEIMALLGKERTLARIDRFLKALEDAKNG